MGQPDEAQRLACESNIQALPVVLGAFWAVVASIAGWAAPELPAFRPHGEDANLPHKFGNLSYVTLSALRHTRVFTHSDDRIP